MYTVYSVIREVREECTRGIGGEKCNLRVVLGLLLSQFKHRSDARTLLDSVDMTADSSVWLNRALTSSAVFCVLEHFSQDNCVILIIVILWHN